MLTPHASKLCEVKNAVDTGKHEEGWQRRCRKQSTQGATHSLSFSPKGCHGAVAHADSIRPSPSAVLFSKTTVPSGEAGGKGNMLFLFTWY
jgi:hypothetical protein